MNQYKVTIPVTFALAAPTPREAFAQLPIIHPFDIDGACRLCTYLQNQDSCEVIDGFGPERLPHYERERVPVNMPRPIGGW